MTKRWLLRALLVIAALPSIVLSFNHPHPKFAQTGMSALHVGEQTFLSARFDAEFLPPIPGDFVHGATMLELPNGNLAAAWYGGTDEIMPDVKIYLSIYDQHAKAWSVPAAIAVIRSRPETRPRASATAKATGTVAMPTWPPAPTSS